MIILSYIDDYIIKLFLKSIISRPISNNSARELHTEHNQSLQNRPQGRFFVGFLISAESSKVDIKKSGAFSPLLNRFYFLYSLANLENTAKSSHSCICLLKLASLSTPSFFKPNFLSVPQLALFFTLAFADNL